MARKKKPEEHENLERWLVSYADFMTLLFATFVVLYALAQTDVSELSKIDEALQKAFSRASILQGNDSIMDGSQSIMDSQNGNSFIQELMTEYISQKYESQSMEQIEKTIEEMKKAGSIEDGVDAKITEHGLLLTFDERYLFASGSAELSINAQRLLDKIGVLIFDKFIMHCIRVEGHTDSSPISSVRYPSNWELSSARACTIVRYLIGRFGFMPSLFTAVGYADTRPVEGAKDSNARKNRRVEILVLKKQYSSLERPQNEVLKMNREQQLQLQTKRKEVVSKIKEENNISPAAKALLDKNNKRRVIDMKNYAESKGITLDNKELYNSIEKQKYNSENATLEKQLPKNEDFEL